MDTEASPLRQSLDQFVQASSWAESQRLVEAHPDLLGAEADALLSEMINHCQQEQNAETAALLIEHRSLLNHCRDLGIARTFAEKMLPAEALAEAERQGLTPEAFLAQMRAAQQMPLALREVLAELAAEEVMIHSAEDLEQALAARPDLRAKLDAALGSVGDQIEVLAEFRDDFQRAKESEQRYLRSSDQSALDSAAAAWDRILRHPSFSSSYKRFQLVTLNSAGGVFLRRYWTRGRVEDLNRALNLWQRAVAATSLDSSDLPDYLTNLGLGLRARYARSGGEEDLAEAIRVSQQAVAATPPDSPDLPARLNNLGAGLRDRFARSGQEEDLAEAIQVFERTVAATPPDSPDLPGYLTNLSIGLRDRFARSGGEKDLAEAIRVFERTVVATPPDSPDLPGYLTNLGAGLRDRYARSGQEEDLAEAIRVFERTVVATPPNSSDLPSRLNNLGNGLRARYVRSGREEDLAEAIHVSQQAVTATPPDSPDLPRYLNNLGNGLRDRYARSGQEEDLAEAIRVYQQAVAATPPDSPDLPMYLNNLGAGLGDRYARSGQEEDLTETIRVSQQAVAAIPPDSPDLPMYLNNLGLGLGDRYARSGQEEDLAEAIRVYQEAVVATPPDSPDLPGYLNNLGIGLRARYVRSGQEEDLAEAIRVYQEAVATTPPDSPDLPGYLNNLGIGLGNRYARSGREEDLEDAIRVYQQAVAATPSDSPDLPGYLNNLGTDLRDRYARSGREEDLEDAIRVSQQAVAATSLDSPDLPALFTNLGLGLRDRYARSGREEDLEDAIRVSQQAVTATSLDSPDLPALLTNLGLGLGDRYARSGQEEDLEDAIQRYRRACELGALSAPQAVLEAARNWGRWAVQRKQWVETAEAYGYGLATGRQILARQLQRSQKESSLRDLQEMSGPAAYALAKLAKFDDAVATVERGRARLLAEALQRNRRDLQQLPALGHEDLYRRYREIVETQERLTQPAAARPDQPDYLSSQARLDAIVATNVAFDQVVAEIQKVPGYIDFLAEPTFTQIQATAQDAPLVYLLTTSAGSLVLIVYNGDVQPIWLDELTDATVRAWLTGPADDPALGGWLGAYQDWLVEPTKQAQPAWFAAAADITSQLWSQVMEPVAAVLRRVLPADPSSAPVVTLIPAGLLALLPLHAAWTQDAAAPTQRRYFLDDFTVRYAPSALALRHARDVAERAPAERLLTVEEPALANVTSLPNAPLEVTAIASLFDPPAILSGRAATRKAVQTALPGANVVHFACHGANNWQNPLQSGLFMADDADGTRNLLSVGDLLDLAGAGGRLATLSACETGIIGTELPDEVVALPSALLQAGFGGVVASLWSVADVSTAMLMAHFYHGWREEKLAPAQALRAAQRWLRDTTNEEKGDYFQRYSPALSGVQVSGMHMPETVALAFFSEVMRRDMEQKDFAHPFWWAAFYLTGV